MEIYTDGCCLGNPGKGGIGIIIKNNNIEISKGYKLTTNNRMELIAVITALEYFKTKQTIKLYTDSNYIVSCVNNNWLENWKNNNWKTATKKPVKNKDLWIKLQELINIHNIKFIWVKGHAVNKFNNRCDELANIAARSSNLLSDSNYENDI